LNRSNSEPATNKGSNPIKDFGLIELSDRRIFLGQGPFNRSHEPAPHGVSFYVNDFNLTSARPWYIPSEYEEISPTDLDQFCNCSETPKLQWHHPEYKDFKNCFEVITNLRTEGTLQKAVPAVNATATLKRASSYCFNLIRASFPHLSSMALAGTSRSENNSTFEKDSKEQHEHQLVVESIRRRLNDLGNVQEAQRETLDIGGMLHFLSKFKVDLNDQHSIDNIIKTLHPTPALGTVPRNKSNSDTLNRIRNQLSVPPMFGSPFGIKIDNFFEAFISIRGLFFNGSTLHIPTGCGLVEGSRIDNEWDELAFKRRWVKSSFGLD
jgi:menaquinone-specific isochorismate synthase